MRYVRLLNSLLTLLACLLACSSRYGRSSGPRVAIPLKRAFEGEIHYLLTSSVAMSERDRRAISVPPLVCPVHFARPGAVVGDAANREAKVSSSSAAPAAGGPDAAVEDEFSLAKARRFDLIKLFNACFLGSYGSFGLDADVEVSKRGPLARLLSRSRALLFQCTKEKVINDVMNASDVKAPDRKPMVEFNRIEKTTRLDLGERDSDCRWTCFAAHFRALHRLEPKSNFWHRQQLWKVRSYMAMLLLDE